MPKTVLFVQHYPDGGSITGLLDLIRGLDPARYRAIASFRTPNAFLGEFEAAGVPTIVLFDEPTPVAPTPGPSKPIVTNASRRPSSALRREVRRLVRRDLPAARRLRCVIRDHGVDLVHANNDVLSNRDAIVAAVLGRVPIVVHVRWLHAYEMDAGLRIDRFLARRAERFVFMSRAIARTCEPLNLPAKHQLVLDDPFHLNDYDVEAAPGLAAELGLPAGARVVLSIGRIVRWKGQDVFLRAMARVVEDEPDALALVVGAPTSPEGEQFHTELHTLAADLGIADRVVFAGARRDVPQLVALSEVVVHSATDAEPFGRVVVEGMAGGRPVVGADAGGVPEIIEDGVTGVLVPPGDAELLGKEVAGLLANRDRATAMGRAAAAAVRARFTLEGHATAIQAIYDDVLAERQSAARRFRPRWADQHRGEDDDEPDRPRVKRTRRR